MSNTDKASDLINLIDENITYEVDIPGTTASILRKIRQFLSKLIKGESNVSSVS